MVATRSATTGVAPDVNRIIAVVTGANSGFGLGICHQILSNLSLPPGTEMPASKPQLEAVPTSLRYLFDEDGNATSSKAVKTVPTSPPPTLTLIVACRSGKKAAEAIEIIMRRHGKELRRRAEAGHPVREGWRAGLKVVWEGVDLDAIGGKNGILAFCERLKNKYPHITSLYHNAGFAAASGVAYLKFAKQIMVEGWAYAVAHPNFNIEHPGLMTADGERGMVWNINTLAPYIICSSQTKELAPLLRQSPESLPVQPRVIYTSSTTAVYEKLKPKPLDDYQLLSYGVDTSTSVYSASKYMGDLAMIQLDREFSEESTDRPIRCCIAQPGIVFTNLFNSGLGKWRWVQTIKWYIAWFSLLIARFVFGSPWHPTWTTEGALPMLYGALVSDSYFLPAEKIPAPKFQVVSHRFISATIKYDEVDRWEDADEIGRGLVKACESIRSEWKRREGLE